MRKKLRLKQVDRMLNRLRVEGLQSLYTFADLKHFTKEELALMFYPNTYVKASAEANGLIDSIWYKIEGEEE